MKKISLLLCSAVIICSCHDKQLQVNSIAISKNLTTPSALYCNATQQWIAFDVAAVKPNNSYIKKAAFEADGHFKITFTEKTATSKAGGHDAIIEGRANFIPANGFNTIALHPQKGFRTINGNTAAISFPELETLFAGTYVWEKINFPSMPAEDFLILAQMDSRQQPDKTTAVKLRLQQ